MLGILLMNMPFYANPYEMDFNLLVRHEFAGPNYWSWWAVNSLFEGTMRGLFSMLFGAGTYLLISRLAERHEGLEPADIYFRRLMWLIVFGLFDAYVLLWAGDILYQYGVAGLLLFAFRNLRPWRLVAFGLAFVAISSISSNLHLHEMADLRREGTAIAQLKAAHKPLTHTQMGRLEEWNKCLASQNIDRVRKSATKTTATMGRGSYTAIRAELAGYNAKFQSTDLLKEGLWESLGFFLLGLALFKWGILTGLRSNRFYWVVLLVGYGIGLPLRIGVLHHIINHHFDVSFSTDFFPLNLYQPVRLALTVGHIALFLLVYKAGWLKWLFAALARVGQMAFTNYLGQSIICTLLFFGYGFGLFGTMERYQTYLVVGAIWVFQLVFSTVWMRYFYFGPLEWVWRSLTYWKRQAMVRR